MMRNPDVQLDQSKGVVVIYDDDGNPFVEYRAGNKYALENLEVLLLSCSPPRRQAADKLRKIINDL